MPAATWRRTTSPTAAVSDFWNARLVDLAGLALTVGVDQRVGARQAAGVAGQDAIAALAHVSAP